MCARARTARENVHAIFVTFLLLFLVYLFSFFGHFETFPYWKWKKTEATLLKGIHVAQLFVFIHFFHFGKEVLQNGRNVSKNCQNSTILTPGVQNMQLRNKSHKIKKFPHIL